MKQVFISHSTADKELADEICQLLERRGVNCWIAPRDIDPGKAYGEEIIRGIEETVATVLVLSENSNNSTPVRNEIERAFSYGKTVIPVRIRNVKPSKGLEFFVSTAQWIDAWEPPIDAKMDVLARTVMVLSGDDQGPSTKSNLSGTGSEVAAPVLSPKTASIFEDYRLRIGLGYRIALLMVLWVMTMIGLYEFPVGGPGSEKGLLVVLMFSLGIWALFFRQTVGYFFLSFILSCVVAWYTDDLGKLIQKSAGKPKPVIGQSGPGR